MEAWPPAYIQPWRLPLGDTLASRGKIPPRWGKVPRVGLGMLEGDLPEAQLEPHPGVVAAPAPEEPLLQVKALWGKKRAHVGCS